MFFIYIAVWCACFIILMFSLEDILLIGLLLIVTAMFFISYAASSRAADAIILLAGVTMGKGTQFLLQSGKRKAESGNISDLQPSTFNHFLSAWSCCWLFRRGGIWKRQALIMGRAGWGFGIIQIFTEC
jgi:hypothetical protein